MSTAGLRDLQTALKDPLRLQTLDEFAAVTAEFLDFLGTEQPTRIISPTHHNYVFFQYTEEYGHKITRPLNSHLFIESPELFQSAYKQFTAFLADLSQQQDAIAGNPAFAAYLRDHDINKVIYTMQQAMGCIGDSFEIANQSRKRIGQLFETLITQITLRLGLVCEPRVVNIPIPGFPGYKMPYQLDLVFSRNKAILTAESRFIHPTEIVGSVKTTSKDRIDKVFLDKYLLTKLIGRDIPVVAIFLHDVQRAQVKTPDGIIPFAVNSTFKTNHFLGYTVALNRLDGVYYVDPRLEMAANERLREQIHDFQQFLTADLWRLSAP